MQIVLGGQNATVQIDESLFRHKPKVKNDYNIYKDTYIRNNITVHYKSHIYRIIVDDALKKRCGSSAW